MKDETKNAMRGLKTFLLSRGPFRSRGRGAWVSRHAFVDYRRNVTIGPRSRIADHCRIAAGTGEIFIGTDTALHPRVVCATGGSGGVIRIGDRCAVNSFACLYGLGGLTIGNDVLVGPGVVIVAQTHIFDRTDIPIKDQGSRGRGISIGDGVWLGAGAVVLDGVTIGEGAIVGANAVVHHDVAPYDIVQGNPATVTKNRKQ
jgi:acetyltransferase-like isoleucine patch superfamily enzyme